MGVGIYIPHLSQMHAHQVTTKNNEDHTITAGELIAVKCALDTILKLP